MGRWQPDARGRLEQAALQLYTERGFDETTVADIAERAGLTERTFFRHFTDKREVLFWGQSALLQLATDRIDQAPASAAPMDVVTAALKSAGSVFDERREQARQRQTVIDANPGLQERELSKLALLAMAITDALSARGVAAAPARLLAETGVVVFKVAFGQWLDDTTDRPFDLHLAESLDQLRSLATEA